MSRKGRWSLEEARAQVEEYKQLKKGLYCFQAERAEWGRRAGGSERWRETGKEPQDEGA